MKMLSGKFIELKPFSRICILYYIYIRIEKLKKGSDERFMLEELCIFLINNLYETVNNDFFEEPLEFTLEYALPLFIFILDRIYSLDFYNCRLNEVIKEISGLIVSKLPILHSNRLFLLWSLIQIKKTTNLNIWNEQIEILSKHIDCFKIINQELKDNDLFIKNGISGIYFLLKNIINTPYKVPFEIISIKEKIEKSEIWEKDEWYSTGLGLIDGLSGSILVYSSLENKTEMQ